ncbi:Ig domain-containing protein [Tundrisphaera lichenicola]|uniref:Ig domain-containing protein n=1 Tax=Tundrisphaera lichenicola TaxID=2029860 RepID=UPI003EC0080E
MRRSRRGGHSGLEFGGSGEDSFVAVVVTKLTGALLFILLLTMVIMALLPKVADLPASHGQGEASREARELEIVTPGELPEAIAGRPYLVALAATGGEGRPRWAVDGKLPDGLAIEPESGLIRGTPARGTPEPVSLVLRAVDGSGRASRSTRLVVYQPDRPLTMPSKWKPALPPVPWREWMNQGFGFLVLAMVHIVGMGVLGSLERRAIAASETEDSNSVGRRFFLYRATLRLASVGSAAALAAWLARG